MDPVTIVGWQRISPEVSTSGMLKERDPLRLAELGVRAVIDLAPRDHPHALPGEEREFASLDIAYSNIPVPFDAPQEEHYRQFVDTFEQAEHPVHVHCIANWRVSAFLYRYHLERGMAEREARVLMRQQWLPDASDMPEAQPWAEFVRQAKSNNTGQKAPEMSLPGGGQER